MDVITILFRWVHVMSAILAIGGAFFARVVLPPGLAEGAAETREAVFLRCRRLFKRLIHICIGLLLITGVFNSWRAWADYSIWPERAFGLWGLHVVLGLGVMALATILLAKPSPPRWHKRGSAVNLVLMFLLVAAASSLKFVRDSAVKDHVSPVPASAVR